MNVTLNSRRILVLDDEASILDVLDRYLRDLHFEPVTTTKWTQALDQITHNPPDLILLDLSMPTVQGNAVLEFIRGLGYTLPVIVISAYLYEEKIEELRQLGVTKFLNKPFQLNALGALINEVLGPSPSPSNLPSPLPKTPSIPRAEIRPTPLKQDIPEARPLPPPTAEPSPSSPHHPHRHHHSHHRSKKPRNFKAYFVVFLVCLITSLALIFLEKLPE